MNLKKLFKISSLTLISASILSACSNTLNKNVAIFDGGRITSADVYNTLKNSEEAKNQVYNFSVLKVFYKQYGSKITDKQLDDVYNTYLKQYTDEKTFVDDLALNGYTKETFRDFLKEQLAYEYGIKENIKISDDEFKQEFNKYYPDQKIKLMVFGDEKTANEIKARLDNGEDYDTLAKENSASSILDYTLSYGDTNIQDEIKTEIYKLKVNETSKVLKFEDKLYGVTYYYIFKMVEPKEKPKEMSDDIKTKITDKLRAEKFLDQNIVNPIIKAELNKVNFKLNDDTYKLKFDELKNVEQSTNNTDSSSEAD